MSFLSARMLLASPTARSRLLASPKQISCRSISKLVRIIVNKDLPNGSGYEGDVVKVKAGYARNYLIPQKYAIYATRQNFMRINMVDPDEETPEQKLARLAREANQEQDQVLKAANILRKYLSNKVLTIYRDSEIKSDVIPPDRRGVDANIIRDKLSFQLKIDLESHEKVHLKPDRVNFAELEDDQIEEMMKELGDNKDEECTTQGRRLGDYIARIWLKGDHFAPLKVSVVQR
mmetsp:Transcript_14241/g.18586  ORF Transcript_14241/g.18586 Transcript_14241/m.18586 type:complete len:233 (-) Transcript_14241:98-796(-)|eukprot:CAMPEP_0198144016 /NCGR_PEP_ID=MMETSP1443-20131203/12360_1 /TAXON_ID=186043 /ORGANISM="Entomoneis sp., Strain CCMP2396" /LENGTH=232 /DNA_ID=CAMNT_0043807337 /DNA_START=238 /DNA_END=936 /DNA_ORIENTATION=-